MITDNNIKLNSTCPSFIVVTALKIIAEDNWLCTKGSPNLSINTSKFNMKTMSK